MSSFSHISCEQLNNERDNWTLVDIRDKQSFAIAHVAGAVPLDNDTVSEFLSSTPKDQPVAVMCYHGVSSQQAADFLVQQGIKTVASVDGGFEHWRLHFEVESSS